jgi:hypothetical protein
MPPAAALLVLLLAAPAGRPALPVPRGKAGLELPATPGPTATVKAKVRLQGTALQLLLTVEDDVLGPGDLLDVSLFFPGAGATARGSTFRFALDGQRALDDETAAPAHAQDLVTAEVSHTATTLTVKAGVPARALPPFPAQGPMVFDLCLTYQDRDQAGGAPSLVQSCSAGTMQGPALSLPDAFRAALKLGAPAFVTAVEGRPGGWVGRASRLPGIGWVRGDAPLTAGSLAALVTDAPLTPEQVGMAQPSLRLAPAGRRPIIPVLSGQDPFRDDGACDEAREVRLLLYLVDGRTAVQVLECPAVTCALGRATSIVLDEEGSLEIGYSNGSIATYAWSTDHFERTEYGMR